MLSEFKRLQGTRGVEELLQEGLQKYGDAMKKLLGSSAKKLEALYQQAIDDIPLQREEIARKGWLVSGS